ncbi:MAG: hypothetical protein IJZ14_02210 [Oscillospiraceae bacterium]|nr:hypothetical protein [Oscillospiraceae bacterium]
MYNRYIPQQDGTHRRSRVEEQAAAEQSPRRQPPPTPQASPQASPPHVHLPPNTTNVGSFLRQLLPKDFDTGDLIVVLLLLLMAGDKPEDRNTALLTLALYCFL